MILHHTGCSWLLRLLLLLGIVLDPSCCCTVYLRGQLSIMFNCLDLSRLVDVDDQIHEPPDLLDELASMLNNQCLLRTDDREANSPFSHRQYEHGCWTSPPPILGKRIGRCSW